MNTDRQTILSLVAMGRITPREAERLSRLRGLGAAGLKEMFTEITHTLVALMPTLLGTAHHTLACVTHWLGGIV